jgi:hypothetical protein
MRQRQNCRFFVSFEMSYILEYAAIIEGTTTLDHRGSDEKQIFE